MGMMKIFSEKTEKNPILSSGMDLRRLFVVALVAAAAPALGAGAQTFTSKQGYVLPDNEISVSYGALSHVHIGSALGGALGVAFTFGFVDLEELSSTGAFSVEYRRYLHRNVAVGAVFAYEGCTLRFSGNAGTGRYSYLSLMPSVTVKWFSRPHVSMYSKAAVGVMLALTPDSSVKPMLSAHLSSVGVDFGGRNVRGFAEAGFGSLGLLSGGLRFCF